MTRCFSVAALAAVLLAAPASAQITFTFQDFYDFADSGETVTRFNATTGESVPADDRARIDALVALRGQGQTWDFTTITYPETFETTFTVYRDGDVAGLPGASNFPAATYALLNDSPDGADNDDGYAYADVTDDQYVSLGVFKPAATSPSGTDEVVRYEPDGLQQLTFPLSFGSVTTDQTTSTIDAGPAGQITTTTDFRTEVVGAGTLVTPDGSAEALMIEFRTTVTVAGGSAVFTVYSWATRDPDVGATAQSNEVQTPQGTTEIYAASYTCPGSGCGGGANSAPTIDGTVTATATAGETTTIDVLANVTDADGDALSITAVSDPAHGTATVGDDGTGRRRADVVLYTADAGFEGEDTFTFTVSDGTAEATGTVSVTVDLNTAAEGGPGALVLAVAPNPSAGTAHVESADDHLGDPPRLAGRDREVVGHVAVEGDVRRRREIVGQAEPGEAAALIDLAVERVRHHTAGLYSSAVGERGRCGRSDRLRKRGGREDEKRKNECSEASHTGGVAGGTRRNGQKMSPRPGSVAGSGGG
ncbi:Ig-like domain-containing protein [Rubrivirga sp.]|uniref:Ig-like domain-containing protein n=1 Tax=Rubrivirga sp. TaxID=1885344 RepID=UPI003B52892E